MIIIGHTSSNNNNHNDNTNNDNTTNKLAALGPELATSLLRGSARAPGVVHLARG